MWTPVHLLRSLARSSVVGRKSVVALGLFCFAWLGLPVQSRADPCGTLPNPVVVAGTPALEPLVSKIAKLLQHLDSQPMTVLWQLNSSCGGVEAVALDTLPAACAPGACITGKAKFWPLDPQAQTPKICDLPPGGLKVDLALSDVFPATCPAFGGNAPAGILDTLGPVSPYALVMAKQLGENAMHAEEGHFVFGAGQPLAVKPWTQANAIFLLGDKDAGQLILGPRIKVPSGQWRGKPVANPEELVAGLLSEPMAGIGILPTTLADARRSNLRILAFQALGQHGAFYPDRRGTSFDKQNVRDGHYPLWGFLHTILRADPANPTQPKSQNGARLRDILLARTQVAGQDVLPMQISAGLVPQCAMRVTRASDAASLAPFTPAESCHCYFEKNVPADPTAPNGRIGCQPCDGVSLNCAVGKCRRNLCEVE